MVVAQKKTRDLSASRNGTVANDEPRPFTSTNRDNGKVDKTHKGTLRKRSSDSSVGGRKTRVGEGNDLRPSTF